jgi:hypothetical protein
MEASVKAAVRKEAGPDAYSDRNAISVIRIGVAVIIG